MNEILLGDANELIKKVATASVNCIYTDVPYLFTHGGGGHSKLSQRISSKNNELIDAKIDVGFDYSILNEFVRVMKKVNCFIWCSKLQILDIMNWFVKWGKENNKEINYEILVWCKSNPTPATNNIWLPDLEYCLYFRENGVKLNDGYENKHKWYMSGLNVFDKENYGHPTCKPTECVRKHLLHACSSADVVLDPFVGSGTTCVVAKELGLNYLGFEINPKFYKIATDRLSGWNQKGEMDLFNI